ncbi:histidine kinase [Frankia sp. AgB32]|nr:histidine kinase [Frankia sp. AgB32]
MGPAVAVSGIGTGLWFAVAGLVLWRIRPGSRTGLWLVALGYSSLIEIPHDVQLPTTFPGYDVFTVVGAGLYLVPVAIAAQLLLSYPSGRLSAGVDRAVVTIAFWLAAIAGPLLLVTRTIDHSTCTFWCYDSPVQLIASRRLYLDLENANLAAWLVLAVLAVALLARRAARAAPRLRRTLGGVFAGFAAAVVCFVGFQIAEHLAPGSAVDDALYYAYAWVAAAALVVPFFAGLVAERLAFASVGSLVGRLAHVSAATVQTELRNVLRDPALRVVFPSDGTVVDTTGTPYHLPTDGSQVVTALGDPPFALLAHDPTLTDRQELLDAAAGAARLALDNARLYAEVRHQLAEVNASRQRFAAAADDERRRLERDLHDGAQQRLFGLGLTVAVLRGQLGDGPMRALVDELDEQVRDAIHELRDVAHGIRPAVLDEQGLAPALAALARRCPAPVTLDVRVEDRLDPILEATAYYVVAEALQNVSRHAAGSQTAVAAVRAEGHLVVEVADDGPGGASASAGTGLRGLADRVAAAGGRLTVTSPPGGGTQLRAELPCA